MPVQSLARDTRPSARAWSAAAPCRLLPRCPPTRGRSAVKNTPRQHARLLQDEELVSRLSARAERRALPLSTFREGLECGSPLPPFAAMPADSRKVRCQKHASTARASPSRYSIGKPAIGSRGATSPTRARPSARAWSAAALPSFAAMPAKSRQVRCQKHASTDARLLQDEELVSRLSARAERRSPTPSAKNVRCQRTHGSLEPALVLPSTKPPRMNWRVRLLVSYPPKHATCASFLFCFSLGLGKGARKATVFPGRTSGDCRR